MSYACFLIAVLVACFLVFANFKTFFIKSQGSASPLVQQTALEQKISAPASLSTVGDIRSQLNGASQKEIDRAREIENLK